MGQAKRTKARRSATSDEAGRDRRVATNRRARHDYDILETLECGIVLQGSEVKALREGSAQIADAYARVDDGELWLVNLHIPPWRFGTGFGGHDPDRRRKLLVHRHEVDELAEQTRPGQPLTLVPLALYFKDGKAKVELGVARGRKLQDKRQAIKERDARREAARVAREHSRFG